MSDTLLLEINTASESLAQTAASLESLFQRTKTLRDDRVISKDYALSLESAFPGVISKGCNLSGFTNNPSKTNYDVAVESITDKLKNMKDTVVKFFKQMVDKFVEWFRNLFKRNKDTGKNIISQYKNAVSIMERCEEIEGNVINDLTKTLNQLARASGSSETFDATDMRIKLKKSSAKAFLDRETDLMKSTLAMPVSTKFDEDFKDIEGIYDDMIDKVDLLVKDTNSGALVESGGATSKYKLSSKSNELLFGTSNPPTERGVSEAIAKFKTAESQIKDKFTKFVHNPNDITDVFLVSKAMDYNNVFGSYWEKKELVINSIESFDTFSKLEKKLATIAELSSKLVEVSIKVNEAEGIMSPTSTTILHLQTAFTITTCIFNIAKVSYENGLRLANATIAAAKIRAKDLARILKNAEHPDAAKYDKELKALVISTESVMSDSVEIIEEFSHETPDSELGEINEIMNASKELNDLNTTQTTLESLGLESALDTAKEIAKKAKAKIKELIQKIIKWFKDVWAKFTGKDSDVAKEAQEMKETTDKDPVKTKENEVVEIILEQSSNISKGDAVDPVKANQLRDAVINPETRKEATRELLKRAFKRAHGTDMDENPNSNLARAKTVEEQIKILLDPYELMLTKHGAYYFVDELLRDEPLTYLAKRADYYDKVDRTLPKLIDLITAMEDTQDKIIKHIKDNKGTGVTDEELSDIVLKNFYTTADKILDSIASDLDVELEQKKANPAGKVWHRLFRDVANTINELNEQITENFLKYGASREYDHNTAGAVAMAAKGSDLEAKLPQILNIVNRLKTLKADTTALNKIQSSLADNDIDDTGIPENVVNSLEGGYDRVATAITGYCTKHATAASGFAKTGNEITVFLRKLKHCYKVRNRILAMMTHVSVPSGDKSPLEEAQQIMKDIKDPNVKRIEF